MVVFFAFKLCAVSALFHWRSFIEFKFYSIYFSIFCPFSGIFQTTFHIKDEHVNCAGEKYFEQWGPARFALVHTFIVLKTNVLKMRIQTHPRQIHTWLSATVQHDLSQDDCS